MTELKISPTLAHAERDSCLPRYRSHQELPPFGHTHNFEFGSSSLVVGTRDLCRQPTKRAGHGALVNYHFWSNGGEMIKATDAT